MTISSVIERWIPSGARRPRERASSRSAGTATFRLRPILRRARQSIAAALGWFPLTPFGVVTIPLLAVLLKVYGVSRNDRIVLTLGCCGLFLTALDVLLVTATSIWFKCRRSTKQLDPLVCEASAPFRTGYSLGRVVWIPLVKVDLVWDWPSGVAVELVPSRAGLLEEITAAERAMEGAIIRRFIVSDVFGLARTTFRRRAVQPITIRPDRGRVHRLELARQLEPGDELGHPEGKPEGDLIDMRRYAVGDPLKHVLWKVYARTGRLLVRMPERAVRPLRKTLVYFIAGEGDEPAAGIARALLEAGCFSPQFWFRADGQRTATCDVREAVHQIAASRSARDRGGEGLDSFLSRGEELGIKACILFVPCRTGEWLDRVARQLERRPGPFRVLIGMDGTPPSRSQTSVLRRILLRATSTPVTNPSALRHIFEPLHQAGAEVVAVDRLSGHSYQFPHSQASSDDSPVTLTRRDCS
jgi:hypothetical protein